MRTYSRKAIDLFHSLLRSVLSTGETVPLHKSDELVDEVLTMAKDQGVFLLVCHSIKMNNGTIHDQLQQDIMQAIYQYTRNDYMQKYAEKTLKEAQILYVPLKGAVIKNLYPEPWMRSSCDVDILVQEEHIADAVQKLIDAGFTTDEKKAYHDISLYYNGLHLELHYNICENMPRIDGVLRQVWKYTKPVTEYEYCLSDEYFAFHIIAHILYHLLRGGCNFKQIADIWLMRKNNKYDEEKLIPLLSACKLEQFYKVICEVTDDIFMGRELSELSRKIETQILNGGLVQRKDHSDNIDITVGGGLKKYIMNSVFLPKSEMEWIYPSLKDKPILLPYYYVKRILSKTIGKDRDRAKSILKANREQYDKTNELLKEMGL